MKTVYFFVLSGYFFQDAMSNHHLQMRIIFREETNRAKARYQRFQNVVSNAFESKDFEVFILQQMKTEISFLVR